MLHTEIEHDEIVERYVRNRLTLAERQAFEEHYFACDECFEKVQAMERFVAGVRDLAEHEVPGDAVSWVPSRLSPGWALWAFGTASIAVIVLGMLTGWAYLHRIPKLKKELSAEAARTQPQTVAQLNAMGNLTVTPEANVPLVILQASRGGDVTMVDLPSGARQLILWAEIGPTSYESYSMEVRSSSGARLLTVDGLRRGSYGAIAVSLPAEQLQPGIFRIKLMGQRPPPASLVSEYRLQIRKR